MEARTVNPVERLPQGKKIRSRKNSMGLSYGIEYTMFLQITLKIYDELLFSL